MKVGIVGASGLIGRHLYRHMCEAGYDVVGTCLAGLRPGLVPFDLETDRHDPFDGCEWVVIAAGMTGIDDCARRRERSERVNVLAPVALAERVVSRGAVPVFLSSDQVFDGDRGGYREEDPVHPVNVYGDQKVRVERYLLERSPRSLVLRLSKTYSRDPDAPGLFAETYAPLSRGLPIRAARNLVYNPTDVHVVCAGIEGAIRHGLSGLYHLASPLVQSRHAFALDVAREFGFDEALVQDVDFRSLPLLERRALNSSLEVSKLITRLPGLARQARDRSRTDHPAG